MGERKVLNKYYPPDFDPSSLPRRKKVRDGPTPVRAMLPMSVRCSHCGCFMGRGLKFNTKKYVAPEQYLGLKIYRFSMKCIECGGEFWIRTNPKDATYDVEKGATKNYEPWKEKEGKEEEEKGRKEGQGLDVMEKMELKVLDAKEEIEELDRLEDLKARSDRGVKVGKKRLLEIVRGRYEKEDKDGVEKAIKEESRRAFESKRRKMNNPLSFEADVDDQDSNGMRGLSSGSNEDSSESMKQVVQEPYLQRRVKPRVRATQFRLKKRKRGTHKGESTARQAQKADNDKPKAKPLEGLADYASDSSSSM